MGLTTALELATVFAALLILGVYLRHQWKLHVRSVATIVLISAPALFISAESMSTFLTCDESYIVYEPVDIVNTSLPMWKMGAFRTTDIIVGIPLAVVKAFTGFSKDILALLAKSLHWLLSFLLVVFITDQLLRLAKFSRLSIGTCLLMLYVILLLPVVIFAMKIITYDAFSLLLGTGSVLLLVRGWEGDRSQLYAAAVFAACAAQEKLIASPLVWICLVVVPLRIVYLCNPVSARDVLKTCSSVSVRTSILTLAVFIMSHLLITRVNTTGEPCGNVFGIFYPMMTGFWPVLRLAGFEVSMVLLNPSFTSWVYIPVFSAGVILTMLFVNLPAALLMQTRIRNTLSTKLNDFFLYRCERISYVLFFLVYSTGVMLTYTCSAFLAPYYPVEPGTYTGYKFNDAFTYFGATTLAEHTFWSIGWANAVMVNALPLSLVLMAGFNQYRSATSKRAPAFLLTVIFLLSTIAPLVYGALQLPVGNRYFNLFLLLICCKILVDFVSEFNFRGMIKPIVSAVLIVLLCIEILPFRPLFGSFRPLWSNYSTAYNTTPSKAVLNPWWMGWGEEISIAGRRLERKLQTVNPELEGITLYCNYLGEWLFRQNRANVIQLDTALDITYTDHDYFILNRMGIAQSRMGFPDGITPVDTISFRGFHQAWVFRGDHLAQAGFRFR